MGLNGIASLNRIPNGLNLNEEDLSVTPPKPEKSLSIKPRKQTKKLSISRFRDETDDGF